MLYISSIIKKLSWKERDMFNLLFFISFFYHQLLLFFTPHLHVNQLLTNHYIPTIQLFIIPCSSLYKRKNVSAKSLVTFLLFSLFHLFVTYIIFIINYLAFIYFSNNYLFSHIVSANVSADMIIK
jgi:hypothetical protein